MMTLLHVIIAIWILKALVETAIGLVQIFISLVSFVLGTALYILSWFVQAIFTLWKIAFTND